MSKIIFAEQYSKPCVVVEDGDDADAIIDRCWDDEATFWDGESECCVVQFPGRPPELYTSEAVRRSLKKKAEPSQAKEVK